MNKIDKLINDLCPEGVEFKELGEVAKIKNGKDCKDLPNLQKNSGLHNNISTQTSKEKFSSVLHPKMRNERDNSILSIKKSSGCEQKKNEKRKSHAQKEKYRKNESRKTGKRNFECLEWNEGRKRNIYSSTSKNCNFFGMGNGSCNTHSRSHSNWNENEMVQKEKSTYNLQSGCRKQRVENCNRNRRIKPRWAEKKTRQKEGFYFKMERVESVTIHKQRSGSEFGKMCTDSFVYNIEVEDNHNYFVDGILVHNCHRIAASTWTDTIQEFPAKHYLGLTATAFRRDGLGHAIFASLGPKQHTVNKKLLFKTKAVLKPNVYRIQSNFKYVFTNDYSTMISSLTKDTARNNLIINQIHADLKLYNENILIVSDRKQHCLTMQETLLNRYNTKSLVLTGTVKKTERTEIIKQVKTGKCKVLFATISLIGEGFDAPDLTALFLTTPIKFSGRLIQACGRILRPKKGKVPRIYDIKDNNVKVLQYSGFNRDRIYKKEWG